MAAGANNHVRIPVDKYFIQRLLAKTNPTQRRSQNSDSAQQPHLCMDDSFAVPSEGIFISSVLGVKSPLRFCAHKSTSKAHVVLRRVEVSDDSSDDEEEQSSPIVHFKLFAQKRFTITPGKEILMTVEDERFKDRAVLLIGTVSPEESSEPEEKVEDGDIPPLPKKSLPPKMRRAWVKKPDESSNIVRTSVGVQATPATCSTYVQAQPSSRAVSTQSQFSIASKSVQISTSPRSMSIQTELSTDSPPVHTTRVRERSLSPMDLDSPVDPSPSSPNIPKSDSLKALPLSASLPDRPVFEPGPLGDGDVKISPKATTFPHIQPPLLESTHRPVPSVKSDSASAQSLLSISSIPFPPKSITPDAMDIDTSKFSKERSRKPPVPNPFVSAGFVTEFTGEARVADKSIKSSATANDAKLSDSKNLAFVEAAAPEFLSKANMELMSREEESKQKDRELVHAQAKAELKLVNPPSPISISKSIPTGPRNTAASSSKVSVDQAKSMANVPRAPRSLRGKDDEYAHASQAVAAIPSGSYSNPLGIRPSAQPPSMPRSLASAHQPKKKLLIGIGAGLSLVEAKPDMRSNLPPALFSKQSELESNLVSYPSPSPPPSTPPPPPNTTPPVDSPKPPPPQPVQIKWKRLSLDTDVNPNIDDEGNLRRTSPTNSRVNHLKENTVPQLPRTKYPQSSPILSKQSNGRFGNALSDFAQSSTIPDSTAPTIPISPIGSSNAMHKISPVGVPYTLSSQPSSLPNPDTNSQSGALARNAVLAINPSKLPSVSQAFSAETPAPSQPFHPLPPKPVLSALPPRGTKRDRPPSPPNFGETLESMRTYKRMFRWPTLESNHSVFLRGEGDLSIIGISSSSDGGLLALSCADRTIRIWNNQTRTEMARLSHNARVASVRWLDDDSGVISLGEDGVVSKWARTSFNHWEWAKVVDIGIRINPLEGQAGMHLAYHKDRIAVSLPTEGVKIWLWVKGSWQPQRSILRHNVTALTFIEDGSALLGGTVDGVLWFCEIPNGTLRAYSFLKAKILSIDINSAKTHALIACPGVCRLIDLKEDRKGKLEQSYFNKETESQSNYLLSFGASFTARGQGVLFGDVRGCALIWDTKKGTLVYGLDHGPGEGDRGQDEIVTAAASLEVPNGGCIVTGTKAGLLSWWSQPVNTNSDPNKKTKIS